MKSAHTDQARFYRRCQQVLYRLQKNALGFPNKIPRCHFLCYDVHRVCFTAFKLVIFGMVCVTSSWRYQCRSLMYVRGLIVSLLCGCLVNLTICNTTYGWWTNHSPPNIMPYQFLLRTTWNQFKIQTERNLPVPRI